MSTLLIEAAPPPAPAGVRPLLRRKGLLLALLLGAIEFWITRFTIFSDGISYLEIARHYARGQWSLAVNAYWSPLYSWLLALARLLTGNSSRYELLSLHVLNLLVFIAALVLFELLCDLLLRTLPLSAAGPRQHRCFRLCASCVFLWASLHMIGIGYCSPDMLVLALNEAAVILLLLIARRSSGLIPFAGLGAVLALSYLAKAAMFPVALLYLAIALVLLRGGPRKAAKAALLLASFALLCAPWLAALHDHQGRWTIGESGRLNYAWEVDGAARSIHWQGEPGDLGTPLHPTRRIFSRPDVYEFGSPLDATYPPWYDPGYWYAGIAPGVHPAAQARAFLIGLRYAVALLCLAPGCLLALLLAAASRRGRTLLRTLTSQAYLLVPSAATIFMYCLVYVDARYIAGPCLIIGLLALACAVPLLSRPAYLDLTTIAAAAVFILFVPAWIFLGSITLPQAWTDQQSLIAREVRTLGLQPGDRIAYVGFGINAWWASLDDVKIAAEVPPIYRRNGRLDNYIAVDDRNLDEFWKADASTREALLRRLASLGLRAVVADYVPAGADTAGWIKLKGMEQDGKGYENVWIRFLTP